MSVSLTFDQIMNYCAIGGVTGYLFAHWCVQKGFCYMDTLWNRSLRMLSMAMLLTPLALQWYFRGEQLMALGVVMGVVGGYFVWRGVR